MPKFRKKPVMIEAIQWDGTLGCLADLEAFERDRPDGRGPIRLSGENLKIPTLEGEMIASKGDWIIRGIMGEVYPCKPDIFAETYEAV